MTKYSDQSRNPSRSGLTATEILIALVVLAVLTSVLSAAFSKQDRAVRDAECRSNLRQWAEAVRLYALDNDGHYAVRGMWGDSGGVSDWPANITGYQNYLGVRWRAQQTRTCPLELEEHLVSYGLNWPAVNGLKPPRDRIPLEGSTDRNDLLLLVDIAANNHTFFIDGSEPSPNRGAIGVSLLTSQPDIRHLGEVNASFADGHVRRVHWEARFENDPDSFVAQWDRWRAIEIEEPTPEN